VRSVPLVVIDLSGPTLTPDERRFLADEPVAGICLFARHTPDHRRARDLVAAARAAAGRPLLVAIDQEGGTVARLLDGPVPVAAMALGAADDEALTEAVAAATARSLRSVGVNVDLAPVADVALDPRNPVIAERAFGADPALVGRHVAAFVRGLQGHGVAATLKHFPGHGDVDVDSHHALPRLGADRDRLRSVEWRPFRDGLAAGAAAVMTAHLLVPALDPALPATLSPTAIAALRDELGFDGVVFSDALDMRAIADRWSAVDATLLALGAGVDAPLLLGPLREHAAVLRAVEAALREGRLDPARIDAAERRVAHLAAAFPPHPHPDAAIRPEDVALMAHAARRGIVALGTPPRLEPGRPVVLVAGAPVCDRTAVETDDRPTAAFAAALGAAGLPVRLLDPAADAATLAAALEGAQALLLASASRAPWSGAEIARARATLDQARSAGTPTVHVALWNPAHAAALPGPALLGFGFRRDAAAALVHALLTGEAPGRAPLPLTVAA
jgi:beta-N-acetylhexosaminidase